MRFLWLILSSVVAILVKENFCVPAIRPLSQRGIIFPTDNWDNCYLDDASTRPGLCKKLEECPDVLKKWDTENIYPKTCYFIKKQQFVCCPRPASSAFNTTTTATIFTEKPDNFLFDIFNTESGIFTLNEENKDASAITYRPSNIFLDKIKNTTATTITPVNSPLDETTTFTTKPSNIFLDKIKDKTTTTTTTTTTTERSSTQTASSAKTPFVDIFITDQPPFIKRRSEAECDLQNPQKFDVTEAIAPSSERNQFPFMAVLGWRSKTDNKVWYPCGGILISPKFVLSAAHCADIGGVRPLFVHLGDKNLTESEEGTHKIKNFIAHPSYDETAITNDLALVELEHEVNNPIACLWTQHDLPMAKLIALGYGRIGFETTSSNQLFKASLTPIENSECQEIYKLDDKLRNIRIVDSNLCAGDVENFRHFCQGDTGGPLIAELQKVTYVMGVTSFGLGCAELPPSIFTRVSSFIDWIEPIVWPAIDIRIDNK